MAQLQTLAIENLGAFANVDLGFCPGVNVIIGVPGVGKTVLLKAIYAGLLSAGQNDGSLATRQWFKIFQIDKASELVRHHQSSAKVVLKGDDLNEVIIIGEGLEWQVPEGRGRVPFPVVPLGHSENRSRLVRPVFIPPYNMMDRTRGFVSIYDEWEVDFDLTARDIVALLSLPIKKNLDDWASDIVSSVERITSSGLQFIGERFYLVSDGIKVPAPMAAGGHLRLAALSRLVQNGSIQPWTTLLWDEPENGLNPMITDNLADLLLKLARAGVQVIVATHSYLVLKELEVQADKEEFIQFFTLEPASSGTVVRQSGDLDGLEPNAILDHFVDLYDRSISRTLGKSGLHGR